MSENKILTDKQNGFSKGKSTITTTLKLLDDIYAGINDGGLYRFFPCL